MESAQQTQSLSVRQPGVRETVNHEQDLLRMPIIRDLLAFDDRNGPSWKTA
jgi:hypothetical protein